MRVRGKKPGPIAKWASQALGTQEHSTASETGTGAEAGEGGEPRNRELKWPAMFLEFEKGVDKT